MPHMPGPSARIVPPGASHCESGCSEASGLIVVTVWAYENRPLSESTLAQSCRRLGVPLLALHQGERLVSLPHHKIVRLLPDLAKRAFTHVLFIDGDDAILTRNPDGEVQQLLQAAGTDFLCGAEATLFPWPKRHAGLFPQVARCSYPNSGVYIATRAGFLRVLAALVKMVAEDEEGYHEVMYGRKTSLAANDQAAFCELIAAGQSGITLDYAEKLVLNLNFLDLDAASLPCSSLVIHGSGATKPLIPRLEARLARERPVLAANRQHTNAPGKRFCLNMIVKNEVANLERCLRSVADHISCWVIGDTGSTDGTQEMIQQFFAARGIPVNCTAFLSRLSNRRNEALTRARTSALSFDYILLTDADMELTVQDAGFSHDLVASAYKVVQRLRNYLLEQPTGPARCLRSLQGRDP